MLGMELEYLPIIWRLNLLGKCRNTYSLHSEHLGSWMLGQYPSGYLPLNCQWNWVIIWRQPEQCTTFLGKSLEKLTIHFAALFEIPPKKWVPFHDPQAKKNNQKNLSRKRSSPLAAPGGSPHKKNCPPSPSWDEWSQVIMEPVVAFQGIQTWNMKILKKRKKWAINWANENWCHLGFLNPFNPFSSLSNITHGFQMDLLLTISRIST